MGDDIGQFEILVCDSSPLITLAAGDGLRALLVPGLPVNIPDMVYHEVANNPRFPEGEVLRGWMFDNQPQVRLTATEVFNNYLAVRESNPGIRLKNQGELAAIEVLDRYVEHRRESRLIFLYEDTDIEKMRLSFQITKLTTGDFLSGLEGLGISPAERQSILDRAASLGRNVGRQREPLAENDPGAGKISGHSSPTSPIARICDRNKYGETR